MQNSIHIIQYIKHYHLNNQKIHTITTKSPIQSFNARGNYLAIMAEKIHLHDSRLKMFTWNQDLEDQDQSYKPFTVAGNNLSNDANTLTTSGEKAPLTVILNQKREINSKEFKTYITLENKPRLSTINFEGINCIQSNSKLENKSSGVTVKLKDKPKEVNSSIISNEIEQGRDHPCTSETTTTTMKPRKFRGRPPNSTISADIDLYDNQTYSAMSNTTLMNNSEQKEIRYQRMRQFNNAASKRCRIRRKIEIKMQGDRETYLTTRNITLRKEVIELEAQVNKVRTELFKIIKNKQSRKIIKRSDQVHIQHTLAQSTTSDLQNDTTILSFDLEFF